MNCRAAWLAGMTLVAALASASASAGAVRGGGAGDACTLDGCAPVAPASGRLGAVLLDEAARSAIGQAVGAASLPGAGPGSGSGPGLMSTARMAERPAGRTASGANGDAWDRQLGRDPNREAYNCVLGVGIGGALGRDGFLGTRVLGQTQVWRDGQKP